MFVTRWLNRIQRSFARPAAPARRLAAVSNKFRPGLEQLEAREVPAFVLPTKAVLQPTSAAYSLGLTTATPFPKLGTTYTETLTIQNENAITLNTTVGATSTTTQTTDVFVEFPKTLPAGFANLSITKESLVGSSGAQFTVTPEGNNIFEIAITSKKSSSTTSNVFGPVNPLSLTLQFTGPLGLTQNFDPALAVFATPAATNTLTLTPSGFTAPKQSGSAGQTIWTFTVTGATGAVTFTPKTTTGTSANGFSFTQSGDVDTLKFSPGGTTFAGQVYTFSLTATDALGDSAVATFTVVVGP
jgi:hypothetical protein